MPDRPSRSARAVAMDLLARREHSLAELRRKLADREFGPDEIEQTLAGLVRDGLANEGRFVEAFVASRIRRGQGPIRIRAELVERGVAAEAIAAVLPDAHDWGALAREVRRKRFGAAAPAEFRERARQSRFLEYRGFTAEQIRGCFGAEDD
jgi:regulatory protein